MDIKDFILIGGGLLIALVIAHGCWIAYRAKREPYRLDIVPDLVGDDVDDFARLRGELPNGGARVVGGGTQSTAQSADERQTSLDWDAPTAGELKEPSITAPSVEPSRTIPQPHQAPARMSAQEPSIMRVAEVDLVTPAKTKERQAETSTRTAANEPQLRTNTGGENPPLEQDAAGSATQQGEPALAPDVEELIIVNVVAPRGQPFTGEPLVTALRRQGLRYGEMNIFHRIDTLTKIKNFSVANLVEPGVFDLADLDSLKSPGMSFFLQLPGPEDASGALEDMLKAAEAVAQELGGDLRDEQLSVLTGQTREHMRQRIADFARRKLFKRA